MKRPVPRIALSRDEAAVALGVGLTFFSEEIQPELRLIRRKSKVLVPVTELERWCEQQAEHVLEGRTV